MKIIKERILKQLCQLGLTRLYRNPLRRSLSLINLPKLICATKLEWAAIQEKAQQTLADIMSLVNLQALVELKTTLICNRVHWEVELRAVVIFRKPKEIWNPKDRAIGRLRLYKKEMQYLMRRAVHASTGPRLALDKGMLITLLHKHIRLCTARKSGKSVPSPLNLSIK